MVKKIKTKLKLKHGLALIQQESTVIETIINEIKEQLSPEALHVVQDSTQLVVDICNCVENIKSSKKLNKKHIVITVITELFPENDIFKLGELIETIHANKLIRKHSLVSHCLKVVMKGVLKKVL